jgi:hypothetical protein
MAFWKRIWQRGKAPEPDPEPPPEAADPAVLTELRFEHVELTQKLRRMELDIERLEECLAILDERDLHRDDDLGPIALAQDGAPEEPIEVSCTVSGPRDQMQVLDFLLRHISHTTRTGQRQRYELSVDCGGAAAIDATRDGIDLRRSDEEERWVYDESESSSRGRRITYGRAPLVLFVD